MRRAGPGGGGVLGARVLLFVAVVIWGFTFVATKVCLVYLDPLELLALRFVIALPILGLLVRLRRLRLTFDRPHRPAILVGGAIFCVHFVLQVVGLSYTSATNTGWIIALVPLVLTLLAFLILGERIRRPTLVGLGVATGGILILVSHGDLRGLGRIASVGDWLVLGSAHTWALYTIAIRNVTRAHDPLAVTFAIVLPATILLAVLVSLRSGWGQVFDLPVRGVVALLFLAVLGTAVAQWFWQVGVARVGASEAGVFLFLEPLATTALAVPYLGEYLGVSTLIGGALVLAGVGWAQKGGA